MPSTGEPAQPPAAPLVTVSHGGVSQRELYESQADQDERLVEKIEKRASRWDVWMACAVVGVMSGTGSFLGARVSVPSVPSPTALADLFGRLF